MDDTWDVTKDCQQDVDQKVCTATTLEEDAERWEDDGKDNLADVAGSERHVDECAGRSKSSFDCKSITFYARKKLVSRELFVVRC